MMQNFGLFCKNIVSLEICPNSWNEEHNAINDTVVISELMMLSPKIGSCQCLLQHYGYRQVCMRTGWERTDKFPNSCKEHILQLNLQCAEIRLEWTPEDLIHSICRLAQDLRNGVPEIMITRSN